VTVPRLFAIAVIFAGAALSWFTLGASITVRTGENDGRVNPANSRKMAARLQAATASGWPIYLVTTDAAGHGQGSPLSVQIDQSADYLAFLFDQLGMTLP